jgi:hypothetical protein
MRGVCVDSRGWVVYVEEGYIWCSLVSGGVGIMNAHEMGCGVGYGEAVVWLSLLSAKHVVERS